MHVYYLWWQESAVEKSKSIPHIILTFITIQVYIQWRALQWNDHDLDKQNKADGMHKMLKQKHKYVPEYVQNTNSIYQKQASGNSI